MSPLYLRHPELIAGRVQRDEVVANGGHGIRASSLSQRSKQGQRIVAEGDDGDPWMETLARNLALADDRRGDGQRVD